MSIKGIGELKLLEVLDMSETLVSDMSFARNLRHLRYLALSFTNIQDEDLAAIGNLRSLAVLYVDDTEISDRGVNHILHLPLRRLDLAGTNVTDRSVTPLCSLASLAYLRVTSTQISERGRAILETRLPNCVVED